MCDRDRLGVGGGRRQIRRRLEAAEEVRLLKDHAGRVGALPAQLVRVSRPAPVRHLDDLQSEARRVRLDDLTNLWARRLGNDDLVAARRVLRDEAGIRGDGRAVVTGRVGDVHAGQLADRGLVLEDRLEDALAHLRLVGRVGREQLAALQDGVDDGRDVVVVDAGPEERELLRRVDVPARQLFEMAGELLLRQRPLEVQLAAEAHALRDVAEQLVDGGDSDRREHLLAVALGQREVAQDSATTCLYASTSRRESTSDGSPRRMRTSQPSP